MQYIEHAGLPKNKVRHMVLSGEYPLFIKRIQALGISAIKTAPCHTLPFYERYHADLQYLHLGGANNILLKENLHLQNVFSAKNFAFMQSKCSAMPAYPHNVLLNCTVVGKFVLCHKKAIDARVLDICEKINKVTVFVRQGYTRCSTAVIAPKALITADSSIYLAAKRHKLDVLKIQEGYIDLPGYTYGFIGGCCGFLDRDTLGFSGNITKHPDYSNIKDFAKNYGVNLYSLANCRLTDIGGLLPITEASASSRKNLQA